MEVITIESEAFQQMQDMYQNTVRIAQTLATENKALKSKQWLTAKEAAEMTGYSEKTIRNRKDEIGFRSEGGLLLFKTQELIDWMEKYYIKPRK